MYYSAAMSLEPGTFSQEQLGYDSNLKLSGCCSYSRQHEQEKSSYGERRLFTVPETTEQAELITSER